MEITLKQLSSLQSYPHAITFTKKHLDTIRTRGMDPSLYRCTSILHPGLSCSQYTRYKLTSMGKKAVYFCAISVLLPALVQNYKKLLKGNTQKLKKVIKKYIQSVLHLTAIASLPAILYCPRSMLRIGFNRQVDVAIFAVGITASYMLEPVSRHLAYLGFVLPKGVQLLFDLLESKGLVK